MSHVDQLTKLLAMAKERVKTAEQRFRETNQVVAEITQDVEGLSQLRDVRFDEHVAEVNRQQQIELDEVVMRKWSGRDSDDQLLRAGLSE